MLPHFLTLERGGYIGNEGVPMRELNHPLFGQLILEDDCVWVGVFRLPALAACKRYDQPTSEPTDEVPLRIEAPDGQRPSAKQEAAILKIRDNEESILAEYAQRQFYQCLELGEFWQLEPTNRRTGFLRKLKKPGDLRQSMRLKSLTIQSESGAGCALATLWFDCTWDEEHGQEIEIHNGTIVDEYLAQEPGKLHESLNVTIVAPDGDDHRRVELLVEDDWQGIFVIDNERRCVAAISDTPASYSFNQINFKSVTGVRPVSRYLHFHASLPRKRITFILAMFLWLILLPLHIYGWMQVPLLLLVTLIGATLIVLIDRWCHSMPPFGSNWFGHSTGLLPYLVVGLSVGGLIYAYNHEVSFGTPEQIDRVIFALAWMVWLATVAFTAFSGFMASVLASIYLLPADREWRDFFRIVLPATIPFAASISCLIMIRQNAISTFSALWIIPLATIIALTWYGVTWMYATARHISESDETVV